jgi:UPF0755 protein
MSGKKKKGSTTSRVIGVAFLIIALVGAYWAYRYYKIRWTVNTVAAGKLYIPTGAKYGQVLDSLRPFLKDISRFDQLAKQKKYDQRIYPGRYSIEKNETNEALLTKLLTGSQDEIAIRIGNYASIYEMAGRIGPLLETDSAKIVVAITKADFARGFDTAALIHFFFPDTYNFHWNTSAEKFVKRMKQEYDRYWTEERKQQAAQLKMSPLEVTTLASIVQLESAREDEQPKVAGLYLNRLRIGMKLDADPTVIFAMRKAEGFTRKIQRVYYKNLSFDSPYNTYRYRGLPPGPICMPNRSALNAVLQSEDHNYIYFVADPARPGYHIYARTLKEQEQNAAVYRKWANEHNVR